MTDVTALGELLIDFTENGISEQGNPILHPNRKDIDAIQGIGQQLLDHPRNDRQQRRDVDRGRVERPIHR